MKKAAIVFMVLVLVVVGVWVAHSYLTSGDRNAGEPPVAEVEASAPRGSSAAAATAPEPPSAPAEVPTLRLSVEWPEQKLKKNLIHKTRVPRGGTFDVVAHIDADTVEFYRWNRATAAVKATPELLPTKVCVNGQEQESPASTLTFQDLKTTREIRWRYELPWVVRKAESEYTLEVTVTLPGRYADLRKSITVEQGISCYDTTFTRRLKLLGESPYCRLEPIGKSTAGREMYFLRVTDFTVGAAGKKTFVMIGAYHGNEPSGHGSILDFVYELITRKENARYLKTCALYIVPCMNPDGRAIGWHQHPNGLDMNFVYDKGKELPEGEHVRDVLLKYKDELTHGLGMTTHQWGRRYLLLSHDCRRKGDWSDVLMKNVGIRISNEMDEHVHVQSGPPRYKGYRGTRAFIFHELGMPSFVLENAGGGRFNIGHQMKNMVREMRIYYAILDQMTEPVRVKPKPHPPVNMTFPAGKNYRVYKVRKPPVIDGKLDEACWQHPSIITGFVTSGRRSRQEGKTTVHVVYDDECLYIAYDVPDLQPSSIMPGGNEGGIWTEDGADFMFDTNLNRWTYFQFMGNANGAFSEGYWPIPGIVDSDTFKVTGHAIAGSTRNGAIEIKIPFAAMNGHPEMLDPPIPSPPKPGTVWGVNFYRNKPSTSWAHITRSSHAPWEYNAMTFTGKTR